jgi:hypothetical protein
VDHPDGGVLYGRMSVVCGPAVTSNEGGYLQDSHSHGQLCMILEGLLTTLVLFPGSFPGLGAMPMNGAALTSQ